MNELNVETAVAVDALASTVDEAPPGPDAPQATVRILKVDACASVSGRSMLTYHLGWREGSGLCVRLYRNTAKGMFCKDWLSWSAIDGLLDSGAGITSGLLQRLYEGRSANSGGFLLAVLKHEGLLQSQPESLRTHERLDDGPFLAAAAGLVDAGVGLHEDEIPACLLPVKKVATAQGRGSKGSRRSTVVKEALTDVSDEGCADGAV